MNKTVCIYHGNCFDGIAAAWVVWKKFGDNVEFIAGNYGDDRLINNLTQDCYENANINTHYILVDFSLPRDLMVMMNNKALSMVVIDHHKSAQEACEGLEFCHFNMNESGASLAWQHFFPGIDTPTLIDYVKDRDLWLFKEDNSHEVNAYIHSHPMTIPSYERMANELETSLMFTTAIGQGNAILRYKKQMVDNICDTAELVDGIPTVNTSVLFSEVPERLLERYPDAPYARYYYDRIKHGIRQWGLRSKGEFDVSKVAIAEGGGGHENAAGFTEKLL
jgi:oligoribonuclease NrnB/cAMP/cGMP phosphodiesterase (DHH superfamily)